ncbi:hypothetical protein EVAR_70819_1 [Eumeta japonica]|uniref:Uncharacterized protein n=1 Tax=Eumeta variegata TaxID=151549 RepID=A0A4C2A366_EUMVA|nr:hypothetical protein EVAR_70819_1 [Eumeta japonica]
MKQINPLLRLCTHRNETSRNLSRAKCDRRTFGRRIFDASAESVAEYSPDCKRGCGRSQRDATHSLVNSSLRLIAAMQTG